MALGRAAVLGLPHRRLLTNQAPHNGITSDSSDSTSSWIGSKRFGPAYENYVGDVLQAVNKKQKFNVLKAEKYGTKAARKDTVDWIVEDPTGSLFVECKAGRVRLQAKVDLLAREAIYKELRKLAEFITQTYATLSDALNGSYQNWKPSGGAVYPVIVTLDNWQRFGLIANNAISREVEAVFDEKGLDKALLTTHPFTVCAIDEFEQAIQVMVEVGINTLMSKKTTGECAQWEMIAVINNFFDSVAKEHVKLLFDWDFVPKGVRSRFAVG
jgi:hypothetical protein